MSYQPEERYWTDYLRIALPVVGLLLMLGLFWFWAASLIGDEDDDNPDDLAAIATATVAPSPSPSPAPSSDLAGEGTDSETPGADNDQTAGDNSGNDTDEEDPDADNADDTEGGNDDNGGEEESCDPGFCPGDPVTTKSDNVRFRAEPSTDEDVEIIDTFPAGVEFIVRGDDVPEQEGDNLFIPVEDLDGNPGWIAKSLLDPEQPESE